MAARRTIFIAAGVSLTVVLGLGAAIGVASAAVPPEVRAGVGASSTAAPVASSPTPTPLASSSPEAVQAVADARANVPVGAAALTLTPGPVELATTACMAQRGYTWSNAIGVAIADAELEAVAASASAGHALTDSATRALELTAAASAAGVSDAEYSAFRAALTGDYANDVTGCSAQAIELPHDRDGLDWANHKAITRGCLATRGVFVTAEDDETMYQAYLANAPETIPAALGWTEAQWDAYSVALWGDTGGGADYHWEEAGCAGYATHATANDHNN
ncbi:hypothetical protein [Plantibacter sp. YIM 135249]|uniref:hypothetical protein n=1 Tax=Plantibacter sp. YIM 135249 TaxID=3423918 RepID=UPI003D326300